MNSALKGVSPQTILDALPAEIVVVDATGFILGANSMWKEFARRNGFSAEEGGIGNDYINLCNKSLIGSREDSLAVARGVRRVLAGESAEFHLEFPCRCGDNDRWYHVAVTPLHFADKTRGAFVVHVDISQRKGAEFALANSEARFRAIYEHEPECVKTLAPNGKILGINPAGLRLLDASTQQEVLEKSVFDFIAAEDEDCYRSHLGRILNGSPSKVEFRIKTLNGSLRWMEEHAVVLNGEGTTATVLSVTRDMTERKAAEHRLARLTRLYAFSSSVNETIVRVRAPQELFRIACRIAVEKGGFRMAWVGLENNSILEPAAHYGHDDGYLSSIRITTAASEPHGQGPGGMAFRTGKPSWNNSIRKDVGSFASKEAALARGYESAAAFPLCKEGRVIGIFVVYSQVENFFTDEEITLLSSLASNLSFAIDLNEQESRRHEAQDALANREINMAIAQRLANVGSWEADIVNAQKSRLHWSDQMFRMAGYDPGQVKPTLELFFQHVPPEDHARIRDAVQQSIDRGTEYSLTHRFVRADGEVRIFKEIAQVFKNPEGQTTKMIGAAHDITEYERARESLTFQAQLLDVAREAIYLIGRDYRIKFWNNGAQHVYGWSGGEALGCDAIELLSADPKFSREICALVLEKGSWQGEIGHKTKNGNEITVEIGCTLIRDQEGTATSFLVIGSDITERKKLESQFLRSQRLESIGTLAGGIAHDLNNILAPISMCAELLDTRNLGDDTKTLLNTILLSSRRAADLVGQVLFFAKGVEGKRIPLDVERIARDVENIVKKTFPKNIELRIRAHRRPWKVLGDATQIHQVLMNLCLNARDALPNGGVIGISLKNMEVDEVYAGATREQAGKYVEVIVSDNGIGMDGDLQSRIFDPFFTTKEAGKGTGLGLSTVLTIVKSHGGSIGVESAPNQGSRFRVLLPGYAVEENRATGSDEPAVVEGAGELILLVDDEPSLRLAVEKSLSRIGYRTITAENGAAAIATYAERKRDVALVLTDIAMPVMDGVALAAAVKSINPDARILGMSGHANIADTARAGASGIAKIIHKPFTISELSAAIKDLL